MQSRHFSILTISLEIENAKFANLWAALILGDVFDYEKRYDKT